MKEYLFYDEVSGEEFLVETDMKEKAYLCAYTSFEEPKFVREVSHWEAEIMGLNTYYLCVICIISYVLRTKNKLQLFFNMLYLLHQKKGD